MRLLDRQDDHNQSIVFASWSPSPFDCDEIFEGYCSSLPFKDFSAVFHPLKDFAAILGSSWDFCNSSISGDLFEVGAAAPFGDGPEAP
ncbi:hypothetical protein Taro_014178 [Colocasia esculenta]|uniref:Uncharacterized protein n=1 Tax=Colocasia esculenta TaxID=4460 RepID=A0A843UHJ4_COLES|nr:hypothetical protein [Colocasia esculenta]